MRKLFLVASFALAIGCGGKKDKLDEAISGLEGWKAKMCACKDKACADKTHEEYKAWEDKMEKSLDGLDKDKVDKGKIAKLEQLDDERKDCRRKFNEPEPAPTGDTPPPPAGEPPPAPAP